MKLNVGCSWPEGKYKHADWLNLDIVSNRRVNVRGSALELPFVDDSFEEIHCIHVLEHLTRDKPPVMMEEMHRVLAPGGTLFVEVPDFKGTVTKLVAAFVENDVNKIHKWTTSIYGKSERDGMAHHTGFYSRSLVVLFRKTGLQNVRQITAEADMISTHYRQEPVLLIRGEK